MVNFYTRAQYYRDCQGERVEESNILRKQEEAVQRAKDLAGKKHHGKNQ